MTFKDTSKEVPLHEKYGLTIEEGAAYFGVGESTLRRFIKEHPGEDYYLTVGVKTLIKRKKFEAVLDELTAI